MNSFRVHYAVFSVLGITGIRILYTRVLDLFTCIYYIILLFMHESSWPLNSVFHSSSSLIWADIILCSGDWESETPTFKRSPTPNSGLIRPPPHYHWTYKLIRLEIECKLFTRTTFFAVLYSIRFYFRI